MRWQTATLCLGTWLLTYDVRAQERAGYLSLGITRHTEAGPSGETRQVADPALPGGTIGSFIVGGGIFLTGHISLDGEVAMTGSMSARQPSRYFTLNEERRELMITSGVRFQKLWPGPIQFEPTIGLLYIMNRGWMQKEYDPPVVSDHRVGPRERSSRDVRFGIGGGVDARIGHQRVAVVPSLRILHAFADFSGSARAWEWTVRPGLSVRFNF